MQLWRVVAHAPPVTSVNAHAVVVLARAAALWVFASRNAQHLPGNSKGESHMKKVLVASDVHGGVFGQC